MKRAKRANARPADPSKQRLRLWLRLLKVSRMVSNEIREKLRVEHATTLPRFDVLAALFRSEQGMKMSELSGVLQVSNGNVTGIVDRLAVEGHLVRVPVAGDRRAIRVMLTEAGRDYFAQLAEQHEQWIDNLLSEIDDAETERMLGQLRRVTVRLERAAQAR
jgi:DNA-binding MarR family transcriptional regulator